MDSFLRANYVDQYTYSKELLSWFVDEWITCDHGCVGIARFRGVLLVDFLCVEKEYRHQGIARKLIARVKDRVVSEDRVSNEDLEKDKSEYFYTSAFEPSEIKYRYWHRALIPLEHFQWKKPHKPKEKYFAVTEKELLLIQSRFSMTEKEARRWFLFRKGIVHTYVSPENFVGFFIVPNNGKPAVMDYYSTSKEDAAWIAKKDGYFLFTTYAKEGDSIPLFGKGTGVTNVHSSTGQWFYLP